MKKLYFRILILLFVSFISQYSFAQTCYELVWSDEFNYEGLPDPGKWTHETGATGWGNNELQYYTDKRLENCRVEDGNLIIEARKESYKGSSYTSARLISYPNGHSWKYGKIEARIKMPYGQGIWPAFWMLGNSIFEGTSWPGCGEIDIIEMIGGGEGRDDVVHGTVHWADANNNHASYGGQTQLSEGIFADTFHVFSVEWTSNEIRWYLDGVKFHDIDITPPALSEFQEKFFLLLNLAVGGIWPGYPNSSTVFPQQMLVDYIRVYQLNSSALIQGDTSIIKGEKNVQFSIAESEDLEYAWSVPIDATIIEGQGTESILVDWGCTFGNVSCQVTGLCNNYTSNLAVTAKKLEIEGENKLAANAQNIDYRIANTKEAAYSWILPDGVSLNSAMDTNHINVNWTDQPGTVEVKLQNACGADSAIKHISIVAIVPYPDANKAHAIPGIIESINYDEGGEGFSYHDYEPDNLGPGSRQTEGVDTELNDGGETVGWIEEDEWLQYSISVAADDLYDIEIRTASINYSGRFKILFNGVDKTGEVSVPNTGSWFSFTTLKLEEISLGRSDTSMRVYMISGGFNLGRMIFWQAQPSTIQKIQSEEYGVFPTLATTQLFRKNNTEAQDYFISDLTGKIVKQGKVHAFEAIRIDELNNGMFFISFDNKNTGRIAYKFIKILY